MEKFNLTVTTEVLAVISEGLAQLPYGRVAGIINELQKQINEQVKEEKEEEEVKELRKK